MNMYNLIKSFKKYLKETPKEQLDKDFEEIENKSHFSKNVEYVILIDRGNI